MKYKDNSSVVPPSAALPVVRPADREPSSVEFPEDHWDATWEQIAAARALLREALREALRGANEEVTVNARALDLALHAWGLDSDNAEAMGWIRETAKRVTGGNCTFADDDLNILEHLANRAVGADLTDGLHPSVALKAKAAWHAAQAPASEAAPQGASQHASAAREGAQETREAGDKPTEP